MNFILKSCWLSVVYHSLWVSVRVISTAQYVMVNKSYDPSDRKELEPVVEALAVNASTLIWLLLSAMCAARSIFYASHAHREGFLKKKKKKICRIWFRSGLVYSFLKRKKNAWNKGGDISGSDVSNLIICLSIMSQVQCLHCPQWNLTTEWHHWRQFIRLHAASSGATKGTLQDM